MAIEIERKFQVLSEDWRPLVTETSEMVQGYFLGGKKGLVRLRVPRDGQLLITFKGKSNGISRTELEFPLEVDRSELPDLLSLCDGVLEKTRHFVPHHADPKLTWEIDIFHGQNEGLILAEIELPAEDYRFDRPPWVGKELSGDKYNNASLIRRPYSTW